MQGTIYKGIGSFYTVHTDSGKEYVCKARGRFRKDGVTPVVGDKVEFVAEQKGNSFITDICPRKNILIRPAVANIDNLVIVMSASVPKPDLYLTDNLIAACELHCIKPILVINKCDTDTGGTAEIMHDYMPTGYRIFCVSAKSGEGIDCLSEALRDSVSCFAGQSAVGKSSILNAILPELSLATGELSQKTERGRHTTRHAELWQLKNGGAVLDTPGFSLLENAQTDPAELSKLYVEMRQVQGMCRFAGCAHVNEPDCAVKALLEEGKMSQGRYERYVSIYKEISELYKHRYDKAKLYERKENRND